MKTLNIILTLCLATGFITYVTEAEYADAQAEILTQKMMEVNDLVGSNDLKIVMVSNAKYSSNSK